MDDDDMRRGKASLHKAFNEGEALLTGDFFLTLAFEILADAAHLSPSQMLQLIRSLSHAAGECGMIGGQSLDLIHQGHILTPDLRQEIALKKTASLFTAAFEFGGIIAESNELPLLRTLGTHFGLAFQLIDDVIDGEIAGGIGLIETYLANFSEDVKKLSCDPTPILALADEMAIPLKQMRC
jgi:geranylgeranyl diphosphate synthase type II